MPFVVTEPAPPGPKAKRRYTRSERQREASRRNIRSAQRAARLIMRRPGYQPSPQRLAANRANLRRAIEVRRRDHSCRYTSRFRHGLCALSLERSLAMAGESPDEYRAHMAWFQLWLCGMELAHGLEAGGTLLDPALLLESGHRLGASATGPDAALRPHRLGAGTTGVQKLATALGQAVWRRMRVFRTLPDWEMLAVCHSLRRLAADRRRGEEITPARLVEWVQEIEDYALAAGRISAWGKAITIDNRVEALACQLLLERGENGLYRRARTSSVVVNFEEHSAEALGNPLLSAGRVNSAAAPREVTIADLRDWRKFGSGSTVCLSRFASDVAVTWLEDTLLPWGRRQEAEGEPSVPQCFEEFLSLVEDALAQPGTGDQGWRAADQDFFSVVPSLQPPTPDPQINELASALWDRLQMFRKERERETADLETWRGGHITSLCGDGSADETACRREALAADALPRGAPAALVHILRRGEQAFRRVEGADVRVKGAIYDLLVKRFGERPEFRAMRPEQPKTSGLVVQALLLNAAGRTTEAEALLDLSNQIEARTRQEPPPPSWKEPAG